MSNELEAGPELDFAVGKAIGLDVEIATNFVDDHGRYDRVCVENIPGTGCGSGSFLFSPSTSLDAAFEAAEKVGLFRNCESLHLQFSGWSIIRTDIEGAWFTLGRGSTVPLAICRAILAFKGIK